MKGKYINTKILLACLSVRRHTEKNIHTQLEETIAAYRNIINQFVIHPPRSKEYAEMQEKSVRHN